jgi:tetratricopeptide (TPR) repeat protein
MDVAGSRGERGVTAHPRKVVGVPVVYGLETFRNRERHCELLGRLLADPTTRLVTIVGRRGIGKSALAAKVLRGLEHDRWPHTSERIAVRGLVYASTRTSGISLERIFLDCARLLGGDQEQELFDVWTSRISSADKVHALLDALGDGLHVVLLDNFEDRLTDEGRLLDLDLATFFDVAFRHPSRLRVLVTSQVPMALRPELLRYDIRLLLNDGLPEGHAVALLRELDRNGEARLRDAAEPELRQAVERVHGVPRAIELIAGAMLGDYLTLPTLDELLDGFARRGDVVTHLVQDRYHRLDADARLVLQIVAVFGCPIDRTALASVLASTAAGLDAAPILAQLARIHMISVDRATRSFALHPMDADFAYSELDEHGAYGRLALEGRVADHYAAIKRPQAEWRSLDDVTPHRDEFWHRLRAEDHANAADVLDEIDEYLVWHGSVDAVVEMHQAIAGHLADDSRQLAHLVGYGLARLAAGPLSEAVELLEQARDLADRTGSRGQEARTLLMLSTGYRELRRLAESIGAAERAAALFHEQGQYTRELHALLSLSLSHAYSYEPTAALAVCDRMRPLIEETGDVEGRARMLDARCLAYFLDGRYERAVETAKETFLWYQRAGLPYEVGYGRNVQGMAHLMLGNAETAVEMFQQGREDGQRVQTPRVESICLYNLAWAYWTMDLFPDSIRAAEQAYEASIRAGTADTDAIGALLAAARARAAGDLSGAAHQLLVAAQRSIGNADLFPSAALAREVARSAGELGIPELTEAAQLLH